jgi:glycosyltransferase involved in cell wall biosynthesis
VCIDLNDRFLVSILSYTAYVPVFNQAATLGQTLAALRAQTVPPAEVLVIDDGSTDNSAQIAAAFGATVLRQPANLGRGAARARALAEARHDFVLCCDASNHLAADFAERGLPYFDKTPRLALLHGLLTQPTPHTVAHRWRGRHLFLGRPGPLATHVPHNTAAAIVRRSAVLAVGNYRADLPAHEDDDLGRRLKAAQWESWCDPAMVAECAAPNTLGQVLARYARWYEPRDRSWSWRNYPHNLRTALRVMIPKDLAENDWPGALVSLLLPHYLLWCATHPRSVTAKTNPARISPS